MTDSDKKMVADLEDLCNLIRKGDLVNVETEVYRGGTILAYNPLGVALTAPDPQIHIRISGEHLPTRAVNKKKLYKFLEEQ